MALVYRGKAPPLLHHPPPSHAAQHEEAAAAAGLAGFFLGAVADRTSVSTSDDEVTIRLGFSA